jgi:hypothetical protein
MTPNRKTSFPIGRCLLFSVPVGVLGLTWGCGSGEVPQTPMDANAEARVKSVQQAQKKFMEHRKPLVKPGFGEPKDNQ